jgi:DNA-binding CsgD family transcriptional regulator
MKRIRISILKEDRIWDLRSQGYDYDSIARIVNCSPCLTAVIRRVRNRPSLEEDPIRRGRRRGWLSDSQLEDIRRRHKQGQTYLTIGKLYDISEHSVGFICRGDTYKEPESKYPFQFSNRLTMHRR